MSEALNEVLRGQRNLAFDSLAMATADLTLVRQDVEGLNKIIADQAEELHELSGRNADIKLADDVADIQERTIAELKAKLEDFRQMITSRNETVDRQADQIANLKLQNETKADVITHNREMIHNRDKVISRLQIDLQKAHCFANGDPKD